MPPRDDAPVKRTPTAFDREVIGIIEQHRGASEGDIDLETSFAEDGLNLGEVEDILHALADHFEVEFDDLKGLKTVDEIAIAIRDLKDFG